MANQNLFNALRDVCGFTALESDMNEILRAIIKDQAEPLTEAGFPTYEKFMEIFNEKMPRPEHFYEGLTRKAIIIMEYREGLREREFENMDKKRTLRKEQLENCLYKVRNDLKHEFIDKERICVKIEKVLNSGQAKRNRYDFSK